MAISTASLSKIKYTYKWVIGVLTHSVISIIDNNVVPCFVKEFQSDCDNGN